MVRDEQRPVYIANKVTTNKRLTLIVYIVCNRFRFDDDRVTQVTLKEVLNENYGGGDISPENLASMSLAMRQLNRHKRFTNAYMLVYIRNSDMDEILKPLTTDDIPEHLLRRLDDEKAAMESKRKEREESTQFFNVNLISDIDFKAHSGFDLYNPMTHPGKHIKVRKQETFGAFRGAVANSYGYPEDQLSVWTLVKRQNDTVRTDSPIPDTELNTCKDFCLLFFICFPSSIWPTDRKN